MENNKDSEEVFEEQGDAPEAAEISSVKDAEGEDLLAKLEAEKNELHEKFLRTVADMENLRKRSEKEKSDLRKYGNEKLLEDILPVLDSFNSALQSGDNDAKSLMDGVGMVHKQLMTVLEKHGLKSFDSQGQAFDPNLHQAIQKVEEDVDAELVKEEFQRGYTLNERLLRPAIVSVSVPAEG